MALYYFNRIPPFIFEELKEKVKGGMTYREAAYWLQKQTGYVFSHVTIMNYVTGKLEYKPDTRYTETKKWTQKKTERVLQAKIGAETNSNKHKEVRKVRNSASNKILDQDLAETHMSKKDQVAFMANEGPQTDFLSSPEDDVLYGGAAGGGKSVAIVVDPLRYCHRPKHRALILRRTLKELRQLIDLSREYYTLAFPTAKFKESEKIWAFPSGAKVEFNYLEKDADVYQYQGQDYTYIAFDEITQLPTEFPWQYLQSRLRTSDPEIEVYMRATANPGGPGHGWVKARYIDPADPNTPFRGKDGLSRRFIPATLKDNPHLYDDGRYMKMLESLPEVQRQQLLDGNWDIAEDQAFPEFNKEVHVIAPFKIPNSWQRIKGVDYGYSSPSAVLWGAVDPTDGTLIIYKELYGKGYTGETLGRAIVDSEMEETRDIPGVIDWAVFSRTGYTGPTIGEILNRPPYSLKLRMADKNRKAGKVQLHERFRITETGRPKLQIFSSCVNTVREVSSLTIDKNDPEDVDTRQEDHAYDALRYICMSRPIQDTFYNRVYKMKRETHYIADQVFGY